MAPKPKPLPPSPSATAIARRWGGIGRDGLGAYLTRPESYPSTSVIYYNDHFVAVNDIYPKASVHTLLLPRSPVFSARHPFDAFRDPSFLAAVKEEVAKLKVLVAKELQRRFGAGSAAESRRQSILNGDVEMDDDNDGELPPGRDWEAEVKVGIHAHPSMNHLHVHVLSREMFSPSLKHRKHYNSFNTPFFVDIADFPLANDDPRLHPEREQYLRRDLVCWRCGRNFKNQFKALKEHLEVEFREWKRE
ncbi:hypothetical protein jhhlp_008630 [Lomentospora prolificans]|uniref:Aprataxin-like protein n=1 Tax=Lomentospora prolificans TaxID=41688 RepID=A0A2N3MYL1_9PEZI|nr:hypothetical protein jhhlp_008630 [Lomentospora prolificans]